MITALGSSADSPVTLKESHILLQEGDLRAIRLAPYQAGWIAISYGRFCRNVQCDTRDMGESVVRATEQFLMDIRPQLEESQCEQEINLQHQRLLHGMSMAGLKQATARIRVHRDEISSAIVTMTLDKRA